MNLAKSKHQIRSMKAELVGVANDHDVVLVDHLPVLEGGVLTRPPCRKCSGRPGAYDVANTAGGGARSGSLKSRSGMRLRTATFYNWPCGSFDQWPSCGPHNCRKPSDCSNRPTDSAEGPSPIARAELDSPIRGGRSWTCSVTILSPSAVSSICSGPMCTSVALCCAKPALSCMWRAEPLSKIH
eukprot:1463159-Pyramimonas_sp.AAC.1